MSIPLLSNFGTTVKGVGKVQLTDGSGQSTHIAVWDAAGTLVDGGLPSSGGGGGGPATVLALTPSAAGNYTVPHGLGVAPTAVALCTTGPNGGIFGLQSTTWDATNVYLIASDAGITGQLAIWVNTTPAAAAALRTITGTASTLATDVVVLVNSASPCTITLATVGLTVGQTIRVKNINTGVVTIQGYSGNIDGGASAQLPLQYQSCDFTWDGTNFWCL